MLAFRIAWPTDLLGERLEAVFCVLYLIFNEGYTATSGNELMRRELCDEAIRSSRVLAMLLTEEALFSEVPEALGLLALLLLHHSRRKARVGPEGELVLLEEQDRTLWDQDEIQEGMSFLERALPMRRPGPYQVQAAISALHAQAKRPERHRLDANRRTVWYTLRMTPSPVIELNRAAAVAMADSSFKRTDAA